MQVLGNNGARWSGNPKTHSRERRRCVSVAHVFSVSLMLNTPVS